MERDFAIPITVLTGFLGSGKTTLLNHILRENHGLRVGVLVNEFGDLSIDHKLITDQKEDVIELANGCVCCSMQGDMLRAIRQILNSTNDVQYILIETTGIADPLPIAQSLLRPELQGLLRLDGIITMVDADNFDENLENAEVAYNQMVYGDILLVNKTDLVDERTLDLIEEGIRKINGDARILRCEHARVDLHLLLDVGAFKLEQAFAKAGTKPAHDDGNGHDHTSEFKSVSYRTEQPFDADRFQAFMQDIPISIFRGKGVLNVAGAENRMIFHQVGDRCSVFPGERWQPDEPRDTELVFIGRDLEREPLIEALDACLAGNES